MAPAAIPAAGASPCAGLSSRRSSQPSRRRSLPPPRHRSADVPCFPADNFWNTRVDTLPVHPSSPAWVGTIGTGTGLHADWGNVLSDNYGIPFVTVTGAQPLVPIVPDPAQDYSDESDPGPYPVPANAPIEGGPSSRGDRHVLVVETTNCVLYELYNATPLSGGAWQASSYAKFPLAPSRSRSPARRYNTALIDRIEGPRAC